MTDWRDRASCKDRDPSLWDFDLPDQWRAGIAICGHCPVKDLCLADAMRAEVDSYGKHGRAMIYGGLTPVQRSRLAAGKPVGEPTPKVQPVREQAAPWPTGAPCLGCGAPCASDRARRRDTDIRDRYLRHVGKGLCLACWRRVHPPKRRVSPRVRDDRGKYVAAS